MNLTVRKNILELEKTMLDCEQEDVPVKHQFSDGIYAREMSMPEGVCLVGALHKTEHFFVISKGKCIVVTEDSKETLQAPYTGITKPGTKRIIYAIEDTVWTTFHVTDETDVDEIGRQIIANSYEELL